MMHPDFLAWYNKSSDFRCMMVTDVLLNHCVKAGLSPVETINHLCDRHEKLHAALVKIHRCGLPPTEIVKPAQRVSQ